MSRLGRRSLPPAALAAGLAGRAAAAPAPGPQADWEWVRRRFLDPQGRMRVTGRPSVTDSFLQAVGLLAAHRAEDRAGFARILSWSRQALARPEDRLWVWRHEEGAHRALLDLNNASQADLLAAWALCEAGRDWREAGYRRLGQEMAREVLHRCLLPPPGPMLLLPAAGGFANATRAVVAAGGIPFAALAGLERELPDPRWAALREDALSLLRRARFGPWRLPADWLELDRASGRLGWAKGWPPRFTAEGAMAVLHLCWAGLGREPPVAAVLAFWRSAGPTPVPAWADLLTGAVAPHRGGPGLLALFALAEAAELGRGVMEAMPRMAEAEDEEAAALLLLARMAWRDLGFSRRGE
ncbi:glycosyl hydrolase family 8 [Rubritepida flocculans]|uniref:glycosyl hydrolase family 8 n=1 Tax=Rubritepida flocculans TaxID=182403 RepID=UPI00041AAC69|nr:glycosyl hydrolase family 8 [Rubritepida flocculans]